MRVETFRLSVYPERHEDVEERNRALDHCGRVSVVEVYRHLVVVDRLQGIHHVVGVEHDLDRLAAVLDRHFVLGFADLARGGSHGKTATVSNGVYSLLADADDTEFWTYADDSSTARSNVLKLGKALGIDSNTGIIHFENGYTLDTSGTLTNVSTIAINDTSDVVTENNGEYTINDTNKNYWIMIAGDSGPAPLFIGKVESVDSDGTVTFSSGYQLDTNGVLTDSGGNTILLPA